ncbi:hypothetical protein [Pantanalinema sp. GBBB05]|uniref:hypothetical protein n=1 Tax=Pantanalinema sp. GBBB05 TaxID=2604139 RepID=UPI001E1ADD1D|nr:hypothetical protein [Pantanalinema sp. GBBB05]
MKITRVTYHALFNLGDYSNEKIELSAQLEEGETPEDIVPKLRERVAAMALPKQGELWNQRYELEGTIRELEKKLAKSRESWNATAEFLRAQGIKPEMPDMPEFSKLLNPAAEESSTVVEGELEDPTPF